MFFIIIYINPNELNISIVVYIGIITVLVGIFLFVNFNQDLAKIKLLEIKFLSENFIKTILVVLMSIAIFITPIFSPMSIIDWNKVKIWNLFRSIVFIIGAAFLPGACLYNFFFHDTKLNEKLKVESFIIKITICPLLSLSFIGISVLILDQLGFTGEFFFSITVFSLIIGLYFIDLIVQRSRFHNFNIRIIKLNISKNTFIILIISLSFILFSIGTFLGLFYLVPGDSWVGLGGAIHIGKKNTSPILFGQKYFNYPMFWSYLIYGLSVLAGLPLINTNALLGPFCYLYITSIYLLMKAILFGYKEKYSVLATILTSLFSGLFYIRSDLTPGKVTGIIIVENFINKSYSYILFFISLALFIIMVKTSENQDVGKYDFLNIKKNKLLILASFFLILCFMTYSFPLIMGLVFIFSYCLFSTGKRKNLRLFSNLLLFMTIIFVLFDILMNFYLSPFILLSINLLFPSQLILFFTSIIPLYLIIYAFFGFLFVLSISFQNILLKSLKSIKRSFINLKSKKNSTSKLILISFTIFLIIEIVVIILELFILNFNLNQKVIFFYYLDEIYLSIGLFGIIAVYLSYLSYRKDKNLFYVLVIWIIISFFTASILIISAIFNARSFFMRDIDDTSLLLMNYWFNRNWFYSIIPFGVLASIGLIKIGKKIRIHPKFKSFLDNKNNLKFLKIIMISIIIFLGSSNFFLVTIFRADARCRVNKEEIKLYGWMSENIHPDSRILIENKYNIRLGVLSITYAEYFFIHDFFDSDDIQSEMIDEINDLRDEKIQYLCISKDFLFDDVNVSVFIKTYLIPNFYNESEYESDNYRIYYAPYFD